MGTYNMLTETYVLFEPSTPCILSALKWLAVLVLLAVCKINGALDFSLSVASQVQLQLKLIVTILFIDSYLNEKIYIIYYNYVVASVACKECCTHCYEMRKREESNQAKQCL